MTLPRNFGWAGHAGVWAGVLLSLSQAAPGGLAGVDKPWAGAGRPPR